MGKIIQLGLPIGNIDDITQRARQQLSSATLVICEDTRVTGKLLKALGIDSSSIMLWSFNDHFEESQLKSILDRCESQDVIVCSDAGSPYISDPAFPLIKAAIKRDIEIDSLPGVTSPMVALELSGLPAIPFHFHGFIPRDKGQRHKTLINFKQVYGTHIFFEGVSRVKECLGDIAEVFPDSEIVITRELTKEYQSVHRSLGRDLSTIKDSITYKGEFVLLIHNAEKSSSNPTIKGLAQDVLDSTGKSKVLAKLLAEILDLNTKDIYQKLSISRN
jgi:16S rRNA (cytidine1402-2'-O)-methyltransferase